MKLEDTVIFEIADEDKNKEVVNYVSLLEIGESIGSGRRYNTKYWNDLYYYNYRSGTWDPWDGSRLAITPEEPVRIYGKNPNGLMLNKGKDDSSHEGVNFIFENQDVGIKIGGRVMNLIQVGGPRKVPNAYGFNYLFANQNCIREVDKKFLDAKALSVGCYYGMFQGCENLKNAPDLPAINVRVSSYAKMFEGCISLKDIPEIKASVFEQSSCYKMFYGCASITEMPKLKAKSLGASCFSSMFEYCISLKDALELPVKFLTQYPGCYERMFAYCTSLETAPILEARKLGDRCYAHMFEGCGKLKEVTCYARDGRDYAMSTEHWLKGVAESGDFRCSKYSEWDTNDSGIPEGWTRINN